MISEQNRKENNAFLIKKKLNHKILHHDRFNCMILMRALQEQFEILPKVFSFSHTAIYLFSPLYGKVHTLLYNLKLSILKQLN